MSAKKWVPPKTDLSQSDGVPRCKACGELATSVGRYLVQSDTGATGARRTEILTYGMWLTIFMCNSDILPLRDKYGVLDIQSIKPKSKPRPKRKSNPGQQTLPA